MIVVILILILFSFSLYITVEWLTHHITKFKFSKSDDIYIFHCAVYFHVFSFY